jgi:TetR/AcrR family transcriptional repressor of nem operon
MKVTKAQAQANRALVVETASQLFRERGFDGVGVADLMAAAGFTHGGFYKQFGSKADLMAEPRPAASRRPGAGRRVDAATFVSHYLSREHRDGRATGCTMAALRGRCAAAGVGPGRLRGWRRDSLLALLSQPGPGHGPGRCGSGAGQDPRRAVARGGRPRPVARLPGRFTARR